LPDLRGSESPGERERLASDGGELVTMKDEGMNVAAIGGERDAMRKRRAAS
jgi:hypothetical protein